jgi:hypothetical protein
MDIDKIKKLAQVSASLGEIGVVIINLMDRKGYTGLKTITFVPRKSPLILVLARE